MDQRNRSTHSQLGCDWRVSILRAPMQPHSHGQMAALGKAKVHPNLISMVLRLAEGEKAPSPHHQL